MDNNNKQSVPLTHPFNAQGLYHITTSGDIVSTYTSTTLKKATINGYQSIYLKDPNTNSHHNLAIHRLVAIHFPNLVPNDDPQHKTEVNHKDLNRQNNTTNNLEWVTKQTNIQHSYSTNKNRNAKYEGPIVMDETTSFNHTGEAVHALGPGWTKNQINKARRNYPKPYKGHTFKEGGQTNESTTNNSNSKL